MTPEQEKIAELFISSLKNNNGNPINWREFKAEGATKQAMAIIVSALKEPEWDLVKEIAPGNTLTLLTNKGWNFDTFESHRKRKFKEETTKNTIETLTIEQLKGDIFQLKNWYWIIVINAAVSIIVALLIKWLTE